MSLSYFGLFFTCLCFAGIGAEWKNLQVKYALWDGFYDIPLSVSELNEDSSPEYVKMGHDETLNVDLYSYPNDPRFSILFDTYGNIAGIRTAYIKKDVGNRAASNKMSFPYDFDNQAMYTSGNYWDTPLWYTSVLFVAPDTLKAGGRSSTGGLVANDIYLRLNGSWTLIPKDQCKAEALNFTKQSCFIGMGMHYFHNMKNTTACKDLVGVFTLYEYGQLIGLGIIPFGSFTSTKERTWFEDPPVSVVKDIVPNRPDCLIDWVSNYGTTSLHIFFKKYPRFTFCTWPWQKSDQCSK